MRISPNADALTVPDVAGARLSQIKAPRGKAVQNKIITRENGRFAVINKDGISRRTVLTVGAGAAGVVAGVAAIAGAMPAQAKAPQKLVKYQDMPKEDQRCDNCVLFEPPSSCEIVEGPISPNGWCLGYARKPA